MQVSMSDVVVLLATPSVPLQSTILDVPAVRLSELTNVGVAVAARVGVLVPTRVGVLVARRVPVGVGVCVILRVGVGVLVGPVLASKKFTICCPINVCPAALR